MTASLKTLKASKTSKELYDDFSNSSLVHHYGPSVRILRNYYMNSLLAQLCSSDSRLPQINHWVEKMYLHLLAQAMTEEFATESFTTPTRMTEFHPQNFLEGTRISRSQKVVSLNLARAGSWPSHVCFEALHDVLPAENLRQDHIFASRISDANHHVVGTQTNAYKIGGPIDESLLIVPDPMGATGSTLCSALELYKEKNFGEPLKVIALHLIITPEYLRRVIALHPKVQIFALRLDRGLSTEQALRSEPGLFWEQERGLNEADYIVPGAGGLGELLNNSYC